MATVNLGRIKFVWQGAYSGATAYVADDVVSYNGSSYICILASTGNLPTNATYWSQMSSAGTNGTDLTSTLTTQGDIVYRDASGLARLGAGTSGQVLTTLGSGANPSWSTVSSDRVRLATTTVSSAVSEVNITTGFSDTYPIYELYLSGIRNSAASVFLQARFGYGGTPTYVTSNYYSARNSTGIEISSGTNSPLGGGASDSICLSGGWSNTDSGEYDLNGVARIFNARSTSTRYKSVHANTMNMHSGVGYLVSSQPVTFCYDSTLNSNAVTAIKLYFSSGNITRGTFVLYGIKTA
jgi:hypothetical protein